jgi:hypothetical protein
MGFQPTAHTLKVSYGTMASADVMAITKWSISPGRLNLFIVRLRLLDNRRAAWR